MYRGIVDEYPETFDDADADYCCDECEVHDAEESRLLFRLDGPDVDLGELCIAASKPWREGEAA